MNDLQSQEIEKRKKLKAPSDGMLCEMCRKPVPGRAEIIRYLTKDEAGRIDFKFYGVCCSWKV